MQVVTGWAVESVFWPFRPRGSKTPDDVQGAYFHGLRRRAGETALGMGAGIERRSSELDTGRQTVGEWLKLTAPPGSPLPENERLWNTGTVATHSPPGIGVAFFGSRLGV